MAAAYASIVLLSRVKKFWGVLFTAGWIILVGMSLVYPALGALEKMSQFNASKATLDSVAYLERQSPDELAAVRWLSTKVTQIAPRESASIPRAPVPAKRSRTVAPTTSWPMMLNSASRARSAPLGRSGSRGSPALRRAGPPPGDRPAPAPGPGDLRVRPPPRPRPARNGGSEGFIRPSPPVPLHPDHLFHGPP